MNHIYIPAVHGPHNRGLLDLEYRSQAILEACGLVVINLYLFYI